jgi:hypothetical protein
MFVCVFLCVGRGLGAGLIPRPRSPTKCLKGSISKKEKFDASKRHKENEEEEEEEDIFVIFQGKEAYEGVSKSFRTGRLERELPTVQLSATRCSFVAIL